MASQYNGDGTKYLDENVREIDRKPCYVERKNVNWSWGKKKIQFHLNSSTQLYETRPKKNLTGGWTKLIKMDHNGDSAWTGLLPHPSLEGWP